MGKENLSELKRAQAFKNWESPTYREAVTQGIRRLWQDPARRESASERMKKRWDDPVYRETMNVMMTGRHCSEETKAKIRTANIGRVFSEQRKKEISLNKGGIRVRAAPLLLRGAMTEEVAQITGDERVKIRDLAVSLRESGELKKPTKEEISLTQKRAHQGKPKFGTGRIYLQEDQNAFAFVKAFGEKDLITKDLMNWQKLAALYQKRGRVLPADFASRVRLEVFLSAVGQVQNGDPKLLDLYYQTGRDIDPKWFEASLADEEDFLCETVDSLLYYLPKPFEEYPKWLQRIIRNVDEEKGLTRKVKQAIFIYLVYSSINKREEILGVVAHQIGLSLEQVEKAMDFLDNNLTEEEWQRVERIINQVNGKREQPNNDKRDACRDTVFNKPSL